MPSDSETRNIDQEHVYNRSTEPVFTNVIEVDEDAFSEDDVNTYSDTSSVSTYRSTRFDLLPGETDDLLNENDMDDSITSIECPICFTDTELDKIVKLQCDSRHLYCYECIIHICNSLPICSLCRTEIKTITIYSDETFDEVAPYVM